MDDEQIEPPTDEFPLYEIELDSPIPYEVDEEAEPAAEVVYEETADRPDLVYDCNEKTDWVPTRTKDN